jgi:hypothetical protein
MLPVLSASDVVSTVISVVVKPGNTIDNDKVPCRITHRVTAFMNPAFAVDAPIGGLF